MNAKRKGNKGESELARRLCEYGYPSHRNNQNYVGGKDNPDVTLPGMHVECKRVETLRMADALEQARRDANGHALPCVMHRKNNSPWVVIMYLDDWIQLYREWEAGRLEKWKN